jgi:transcriptional regulator with PAS, ATPase and Fis domain
VVDCGALPKNLIEAEFFGHEKGAFTGAHNDREGVFERTWGGTVFLDEIGELPIELQSRLLRVLDRRTVQRLGGDLPRKVDIRLIAATNRNLEKDVEEGRFRKDLFYRLAVVRITMPPLRDRREDIAQLAKAFLWRAGCAHIEEILIPRVIDDLERHHWPGNVRELRNAIDRMMLLLTAGDVKIDQIDIAALLRDSSSILASSLTSLPQDASSTSSRLSICLDDINIGYKQAKTLIVNEFEKKLLEYLIGCHGLNVTQIARDAGVDRHFVRDLLRKHGYLS